MRIRFVLAALAALIAPLAARADCQVSEFLDLPIAVTNMHPLVDAEIDGVPARFVVDSGAFANSITSGAAKAFHLELEPGPVAEAEGVGGDVLLSMAMVKVFTLAHYGFKKVPFFVGGGEVGDNAAGLLGQELLSVSDVDYDFAGGMIRFMRPKDCGDQPMAYWLKPGQTFGELAFGSSDPDSKDIVGTATVNGVKIKVLFDTGGAESLLSRAAAKRAGISLTDAGVVDGEGEAGIGRYRIQTWIAPVKSFEIGGEEIHNTRLRIGDWATTYRSNPDMILGDDFFLSHHVFVANSQHKIYFTYNGGPVFNLEVNAAAPDAKQQPTATTAGGWVNLGAVELSRQAWTNAIADFGHAIDLDRTNPQSFYQRAEAYWGADQEAQSLKDLDRAVALKPDYPEALLLRGRLRNRAGDQAGARADFALVDKALGKDSDFRLDLAFQLNRARQPGLAIASFDDWIAVHPDDSRLGWARVGRCWSRALVGSDLDKAMDDCQRALRAGQIDTDGYRPRGVLFLRQGAFDKAIADFNQALKFEAKDAWAIYGRGVAEQKSGQADQAKSDFAAAAAIDADIAKTAAGYGIGP